MGLLSWLFPKPADKIAKARGLMEAGRYAEARLAVIDLSEPEAKAVVTEAESLLVKVNLEMAVQRCRAGDEGPVAHHLELAEQFHQGDQQALFDETMAELARLRVERAKTQVWDGVYAAADRRRKLGDDPGDFVRAALTGEGAVRLMFGNSDAPFGLPGIDLEPRRREFVPDWLPPAATADREAYVAALKAAWPAELHPHIDAAGDRLVDAMIALAEQRPEAVIALLKDAPIDNPVTRFELGRAAAALGGHEAAVVALMQAREAVDSAFVVGGLPLRVFGSRCMRWAGARQQAWATVSDLSEADRAYDPHLYIALAIENGALDEADAAIEALPDDDTGGLQLDAALTLRKTLAEQIEAHPVLTDEAAEGTPPFKAAAQAVTRVLQAEVDHVIGELRAAAEAEEAAAAEADDDDD